MSIARTLYSLLTWAAQPLLKRKLRRRAQAEPGYAQAVPERFGYYCPDTLGRDGAGQWVWIHAVSLGETRAAALLINTLRTNLPQLRLLLTHSTATGRAEGQKLLLPDDVQVWLPWDTPAAVQRFLQQFQPLVGVLMETEVWPNLVAGCQRAGVPLVLTNARLNAQSFAGAKRWSALSRPAYAALAAVLAQTTQDAERLRQLGAPQPSVLGNLKFDVQPDPALLALGASWRSASRRPVLLLASSREGEEAMWLDVLKHKQALVPTGQAPTAINKEALPPVQWLVVPRHPQRFDEVQQLLEAAGLRVSRRSQWSEAPQNADVWLGDSLGEMALYYGMAHVALLGGSFAPLGGQNLIEAAACGCPVVMGPHTFNFAQAADLAMAAGAAQRVSDMAAGIAAACALAADGPRQAQLAQRCQSFTQTHRGAAQATARAVVRLLAA